MPEHRDAVSCTLSSAEHCTAASHPPKGPRRDSDTLRDVPHLSGSTEDATSMSSGGVPAKEMVGKQMKAAKGECRALCLRRRRILGANAARRTVAIIVWLHHCLYATHVSVLSTRIMMFLAICNPGPSPNSLNHCDPATRDCKAVLDYNGRSLMLACFPAMPYRAAGSATQRYDHETHRSGQAQLRCVGTGTDATCSSARHPCIKTCRASVP